MPAPRAARPPFAVPAPPAPPVFHDAAVPQIAPAPPAPAVPPMPAPFAAAEPPAPPAPAVPELFAYERSTFALDESLWQLKESLADMRLEMNDAFLAQKGPGAVVVGARPFNNSRDEALYDQARSMIERDQYERAVATLDRVIDSKGTRADAAMYWKAYSLSKLTRRPEALTVIAELQKQFPNSAWTRDARGLEVEIRQASGQSVSPDLVDDEAKVLALRGLMQSDSEAALPAIEKLLAGNSSVRVKDRALFVLSQSRSPQAQQVIMGVARNASNPDLRMSAVRYLGMRPDAETQKLLADLYTSTSDVEMKRAILRSLMSANARERLLAVAKTEKSAELRAVAVQQLGAVRGATELEELYRTETDRDVKRRILQSMIAANAGDKLAQIARTEKDAELQRMAIRNLGASNRPESVDALRALYSPDASVETKKAVIEAMAMQPNNCGTLVMLARGERNQELQREMVRRLSTMTNRCTAARDYMVEILK
jgi:tetratricopeptide (TPR) repeat protein